MSSVFSLHDPAVSGNPLIRTPQQETYRELVTFAGTDDREGGIILPVGCGKSGCIALAPFAFKSQRTLVVAPGLRIAKQLADDFDPARPQMFYQKTRALPMGPYPEPVEIRGTTTNRSDLNAAEVVITNIQQLQGDENRWLSGLPSDYFDLILFDEGHHSVAATWETLKNRFPEARVVNFSATPLRADGQLMGGKVIYSFPVCRAIQEGYVKRLKAVVLNPQTLRYVRREDDVEIEVSLEDVKRLGETESDFRRSIVTSKETLNTIVDASIRELQRIRTETGDQKHKIIASALNYEHCAQIVSAYQARGQRAAYVHSREEAQANDRVMARLESHELDVIVQVRKLGEGFDHPYLSVAAVFSVFANLSPFVQFVGRIMRVIVQNEPGHLLNQGTVVFHAGSNIASRWSDFQQYSEADREFFDQLLPLQGLDFSHSSEVAIVPVPRPENTVSVRSQSEVHLEEIHLIEDQAAMAAIRLLQERGYSPEEVAQTMKLQPVPVTRARQRQAARTELDTRIKTETGRILGERNVSPGGHELDKAHLGKDNYVIVSSAIQKEVNALIGRKTKERSEVTQTEYDQVESQFAALVATAEAKVFNG